MKPNVLFVLLDGSRTDSLHTSKDFQELQKEGTIFNNVSAAYPYTFAAMNAIFTGVFGKENGVNAYYKMFRLKENIPFLPEILQKNGYFTSCDLISDKVISKRGSETSIGFGAKVKHFQDQSSTELIKNLEPEDLIKYGLIPEFVGRMPILATLEELDEKSLVKILKEPKNSLIKQYKRLFEFENAKLNFKDEAILEIAKKAINKKTGARGLRSIIESLLLKTMFKLPALEDVDEVTINASVVKNSSEPIITYTKNKKTTAA